MQTAVRIVVLDYYMSAPIPGLDVTYSEFRGTSISQVPVLRCFGSTENGNKICLHIHGVFPYLYIPYDGRGRPEELMHQIAAALDKAINVSFNQASSNSQHVYKVSLVSGIPMYGYHSKTHQFLKIYLYNPMLILKAGNILLNRKVLDQVFQPHEIHLNFTLQFMIDYNLHGMSNMLISDIKYRTNPHNNNDIDEHYLYLPREIQKTSTCELEADINADSIINRLEVLSGNLAINPGIAALWEDEKQRRRNKNENSQLGHFLELKNLYGAPTKTHLIFQQALKERLAVLSTDNKNDLAKQSPDVSVYPAETPQDANIQNASFVKVHPTSSFELYLDDTLGVSCSQSFNETIMPAGAGDVTLMDEDAQGFLRLLEELAEEKVAEQDEEAILSQAVLDDERGDLGEDFLDLSMPLGSHTTPTKINCGPVDHNSDAEDKDYFNTTLIPQVDGQIDYTDSDDEPLSVYLDKLKNPARKDLQVSPVKQKCCGRSMPLLNITNMTADFSVRPSSLLNKFSLVPYVKLVRLKTNLVVRVEPLDFKKALKTPRARGPNTRSGRKRSPEDVLENTLRLVRFRMGRIKSKSVVKNVGKVLRSNDRHKICLFKTTIRPKFNISAGKKWFLESPPKDDNSSSVITRLLELTHNYTDPDLHILVKTPLISYLFYYGGYTFPCIVEIPSNLPNADRDLLWDTYNVTKNAPDKTDIIRRKKLAFLQKQILNLNVKRKATKSLTKINTNVEKSQIIFEENIVSHIAIKQDNQKKIEKEPVLTKQEEADLRAEAQQANLVLGNHVQFLKDFEFSMGRQAFKTKQNPLIRRFDHIACLNTFKTADDYDQKDINNVNFPAKTDLFSTTDWNHNNTCDSTDYEVFEGVVNEQHSVLGGESKSIILSQTNKLNQKNPFKSSATSSSIDSDYVSFVGNNSTRHPSYDSENDLSKPMMTEDDELSFGLFKLKLSPVHSDDLNSGKLSPWCDEKNEVDSVLNSPENSSTSSPEVKSEKQLNRHQINVISNIQLPSPLKIRFIRRSASSIPFGIGTDIILPKIEDNTSNTFNQNYCAKPLTKRRHTIPNMYINCDGAADSSSEEEQKAPPKRKNSARGLRSSQYAPLGITVTKSPRVRPGGLGPKSVSISGNHHTQAQEITSIADIPFKRKLAFESESALNNTTISEEFISCTYSSKSSSNALTLDNHNSVSISSSSDSDLFSQNDDLNKKSFFKSYDLSVSEKYDKENNYKAKEGCSTVFTPISHSQPNSSQEKRGLSDNTSSDIPPYQQINDNNLSNKNKRTTNQNNTGSSSILKPAFNAPSKLSVETSLTKYNIPRVQQQEPYYSDVEDYAGIFETGHRIMRIASKTTAHLPEFDSPAQLNALTNHRQYIVKSVAQLQWNPNNVKSLKLTYCNHKTVIICPVKMAPSVNAVREWVKAGNSKRYCEESNTPEQAPPPIIKLFIPNNSPSGNNNNDSDLLDFDVSLSLTPLVTQTKTRTLKKANNSCQISGTTQQNTFGFDKSVQDLQAARALTQHQHLTTMVMELHIRTRGDLKPDPQFDNICAIFYSILNDVPPHADPKDEAKARGVIAVNCLPADLLTHPPRPDLLNGLDLSYCNISYVNTEQDLIHTFITTVIKHWDPDILAGYEIEMLSWGYLVDRAFALSINIVPLLGRSQLHKYGKAKQKYVKPKLETSIIGRIVLNVWRIMRHEVALQSYTFESIVYHILHRRVAMCPFKDLTFWWDHKSNLYRHRVVRYYLQRVDTILELFDKLDFLNRTSELAKLFGIMFYEVLSRGSQFRVESMMLRLAKPLNYVPVSPDVTQRANMKAPEYIPLVMEPESKLYTDPVIVLDFQSLYPSLIIGYNYCFTTCVGRVNNLGNNHPFEFGATQLKIPKKLVEKLCKRDLLNYSPCGVAFVKQKVREGILPRMLKEVLDTRLMVKNSMKENNNGNNDNLQKVLHNRQLGLKLIANVTYGYTAANFSGRMCCVEVGDSVVSKGRETLQRAIALVENTPEWEARVVYGDTDSMFVLVQGKTKEEAFEIGKKIADAVTADNPDPVKLKLEKVYQPCILQTKKRYVGYMYESPEQKEPVYEAKGIETVRRDGCPAVAKMLQKCLTLLFETKNVSLIKHYVLKQFNKIQTGRASIQDLTFAKEYRGASGYKPGACVPALELAHKWTAIDRRNEPRSGERVPYVIVNGPPGLPLIRLVRSPRDLLNDSSLRPNALYYITKVIIPPINRCLNLIGADLNIWFNQMPRKSTQYLPNSSPIVKSTISQYFATRICASCLVPSQEDLCAKCCRNVNVTALILTEKLKRWEANYHNTLLICQSCTGYVDHQVACASLDCPVLYRRNQTLNDLQQSTYVRELLSTNSIFSEGSF